jgi:hypothetical protein
MLADAAAIVAELRTGTGEHLASERLVVQHDRPDAIVAAARTALTGETAAAGQLAVGR